MSRKDSLEDLAHACADGCAQAALPTLADWSEDVLSQPWTIAVREATGASDEEMAAFESAFRARYNEHMAHARVREATRLATRPRGWKCGPSRRR